MKPIDRTISKRTFCLLFNLCKRIASGTVSIIPFYNYVSSLLDVRTSIFEYERNYHFVYLGVDKNIQFSNRLSKKNCFSKKKFISQKTGESLCY